jgi:predicted dehydrogenase
VSNITRRAFLNKAAVVSAFSIVPRFVLGGPGYRAPSEKINIAGIGVGGVGKNYLKNVNSENIVALCDVDLEFARPVFETYPDAKVYQDYREMLDREKEIDAVVIGTPDNTHAVIVLDALKKKKHIYCAKPLTRTIEEARKLTIAAKNAGVATQMSTQSDDAEGHRLLAEWIQNGIIGDVHETHIWSNRPIWPQGLDRPEEIPSVPPSLNWGLWIGPSPFRPYHPAYHPFKFRGWYDFGTGALGDMGCHQFNPVVKALKLKHPTSVHASSTKLFEETYPIASMVHYDFPARNGMVPVRLTWYDGNLKPRRPAELEENRDFGMRSGGILLVGSKGKILADSHSRSPRLIPESKMESFQLPPKTVPRSIGHYEEWIAACKGGDPAGVDFKYGGPLTEIVLLGNLAVRTGKKLYWDWKKMKITNDEEANKYISEPYHNAWKL